MFTYTFPLNFDKEIFFFCPREKTLSSELSLVDDATAAGAEAGFFCFF
jgi:hypothetical protein